MTQMVICLGVDANTKLTFDVGQDEISKLWVDRMNARPGLTPDNPRRFYGFNNFQDEVQNALATMAECINVVNRHHHIIDRTLTDVRDQDTLNYLHNIFEQYHGQLDQQTHDFWLNAPESVRKALADINITVHRCESARTGQIRPRFVCTWYGMPKIKRLPEALQEKHIKVGTEFGGVYLNYCEIGKTAKDMAYDNDKYMADNMFQPFSHYSADFSVQFIDDTDASIAEQLERTANYVTNNSNFFQRFGVNSASDIRVLPSRFKVAQLQFDPSKKGDLMTQIQNNQYVHSVIINE